MKTSLRQPVTSITVVALISACVPTGRSAEERGELEVFEPEKWTPSNGGLGATDPYCPPQPAMPGGPGEGTTQPPPDPPDPPVPGSCNDGIDNDGDGLVDWQYDLGCTDAQDGTEGGLTNALDNGWSVFEPTEDTTIFYVSSSEGDDSYSGLAPHYDGTDGPKRTVAAGLGLLTDGKPDWLLFKRGDTWVGENFENLKASGRSELEPVVIASYGDSTKRPRFEVLDSDFMGAYGGGGASPDRAHLRIMDLHAVFVTKDPDDARFTGQGGSCVSWLQDGGDVLFENMRCDWGQFNLQSNPTMPFCVRRNVFNGNYALVGLGQAIYVNMTAPLVIEENVVYHGGWNRDFRLALWSMETDPAVWGAISDGRFGIQIDGVHHDVDGVDMSGVQSMAEVASRLESAINGALGQNAVTMLYSDQGHAMQLRAPSLPTGDYALEGYQGAVGGTDLDALFDLGAQASPSSNVFDRNLYLHGGHADNKTLRGNIVAMGSSGGVQMRPGGLIEGNLFLREPIAMLIGSFQNESGFSVHGAVRDNVVLGGRNVDTVPIAIGLQIASYAQTESGGPSEIDGVEVTGNIIGHNILGSGNIQAISLAGDGAFRNLSIHDNVVYDWAQQEWSDPLFQMAICLSLETNPGSSIEVYSNAFQQPNGGFLAFSPNDLDGVNSHDNTYWSAAPDPPSSPSAGWFFIDRAVSPEDWVTRTGDAGAVFRQLPFVDPDRDIEQYMEHVGGDPSFDAFMAGALEQSRHEWDPSFTAAAVNAYVRAGFELAGGP